MNLQLEGKCAIVCAASRGLGKATALALAREGAAVAICARSESVLREAADEIRAATNGTVVPIVADVARAEDRFGAVTEPVGPLVGPVGDGVARVGGRDRLQRFGQDGGVVVTGKGAHGARR